MKKQSHHNLAVPDTTSDTDTARIRAIIQSVFAAGEIDIDIDDSDIRKSIAAVQEESRTGREGLVNRVDELHRETRQAVADVSGKPKDFIGAAAKAAALMLSKAQRLRADGGNLKCLFYGPPGTGKTATALLTANALAGHSLAIEHVNGKDVTIDLVRQWLADLATGCIFSDWTVKLVDELDLCSRDAQNLLLTYLDRLPGRRAFVATSNCQLDLLQERFHTRLQQFSIPNPESDEIAAFLGVRTGLDEPTCQRIAVGCGGNVRAALLDAESVLDAQALHRPRKGGRK